MLRAFLSLLFAAAAVHGGFVTHNWELTAKGISPDGFQRNAEVVNGVFPGPLLSANKGDVIRVNVKNSLFDPTMRRSTSIVCTIGIPVVFCSRTFAALAWYCGTHFVYYRVASLSNLDL